MLISAAEVPLENGNSLCLNAAAHFTSKPSEGGDIAIEGWGTTEQLNMYKQIVLAEAFAWSGGLKDFNGRTMYFHNMRHEPVGLVEELRIVKGKGLWIRAHIFKEAPELFRRAILEGVLNGFSIGFDVVEYKIHEKKETITFLKCSLNELSIVNIGANRQAKFKVVNDAFQDWKPPEPDGSRFEITLENDEDDFSWARFPPNDGEDEDETETEHNFKLNIIGDTTMPEKKIIAPEYLLAKDYRTEADQLKENMDKLEGLHHTIQEEVDKVKSTAIDKATFAERMDKVGADLDAVTNDIAKAQAQIQMQGERFVYNDYRSMLDSYEWLHHENGKAFTDVEKRAHALFSLPIDYEKFDRGQELINLRNLHDAVYAVDAWQTHAGGKRYRLEDEVLFQQFVNAVEPFDSKLAHAMGYGNVGFGAEWVPQEMSAQFGEYMRIQPNLPNMFPTWMMPTGASAKFPFANGRATVYKGSEQLVDSGQQARKTNLPTGVKTFTPDLFIGALVSSEQLTEDSIINMITFIRTELARALIEGLEGAICNGDDSSTHLDNGTVSTTVASYSVETCFKGLRKLAHAATLIDADSADAGVSGTLAVTSLVACQTAMGAYGLRQSECVWVTGVQGRGELMLALQNTDALGILAYIISGKLPNLNGSPVYVSGEYRENLDGNGVYHGTNLAHTTITCAHKPSFRIGQRRGVTLEVAKDILTQQHQFVATGRWDFGQIVSTDLVPVKGLKDIPY